MSTPDLHLHTLFRLDSAGRIRGTREPKPSAGPLFALIRGRSGCAWAVRADLPQEIAEELNVLAGEEPPVADLRDEPVHAQRYRSLAGGEVYSGPAYTFPETVEQPPATVLVNEAWLLDRNFRRWTAAEIPGRSPVAAVVEDGGGCECLLLCPALQRGGRSRTGDGSSIPWTRPRPAGGSGVGIGGSSVRPHSAIQHVVVERRFAVGCWQVGSGGVCERVEFGVGGWLWVCVVLRSCLSRQCFAGYDANAKALVESRGESGAGCKLDSCSRAESGRTRGFLNLIEGDHLRVSTIEHSLRGRAHAEKSRAHLTECTLYWPFRGLLNGPNHTVSPNGGLKSQPTSPGRNEESEVRPATFWTQEKPYAA